MRRAVMAGPTAWRITREEYHRLGEAGFLEDDRRTELIDGEVVMMGPIGLRHAAGVDRLAAAFRPLPEPAVHRVQGPIVIGDDSEPLPDFSLLRDHHYLDAHPGPDDVRLVVEVAVTSLKHDRLRKGRLYGRSGIREYWIVDLIGDVVEIQRDPGPEGFRDVTTARRGDVLSPVAFPQFSVSVDELLGPSPTPA